MTDYVVELSGISIVTFTFAAATWFLSLRLERIANPTSPRHPSSHASRRIIVTVEVAAGIVFALFALLAWIAS